MAPRWIRNYVAGTLRCSSIVVPDRSPPELCGDMCLRVWDGWALGGAHRRGSTRGFGSCCNSGDAPPPQSQADLELQSELTPHLRDALPAPALHRTPQPPPMADSDSSLRTPPIAPKLASGEPTWLYRRQLRRTLLLPAECVARSPTLPSTSTGGDSGVWFNCGAGTASRRGGQLGLLHMICAPSVRVNIAWLCAPPPASCPPCAPAGA